MAGTRLSALETWIEKLPTSKIIFCNKAIGETGNVVCEAQVTLVFINDEFRPIKSPDAVIEALKANGVG